MATQGMLDQVLATLCMKLAVTNDLWHQLRHQVGAVGAAAASAPVAHGEGLGHLH